MPKRRFDPNKEKKALEKSLKKTSKMRRKAPKKIDTKASIPKPVKVKKARGKPVIVSVTLDRVLKDNQALVAIRIDHDKGSRVEASFISEGQTLKFEEIM